MRDEELYIVEVNDFVFNGILFSEIQIPLNHINFDKNNNKRSDYSIEEAAELIIELLNNEAFEAIGHKNNWSFFSFMKKLNKKKYKIVFSTEKRKITIRVLTLFRTRK